MYYEVLRSILDDKELVDLTTLIGMINLWNRLAISFRYEHPDGSGGVSDARAAPRRDATPRSPPAFR